MGKQCRPRSDCMFLTKYLQGFSRKKYLGGVEWNRIFFFVVLGFRKFQFFGFGGEAYFSFLGGRVKFEK